MLAGGAAGAVYWLCVYPADIIKSKLQTDNFRKPAFKGSLDCARQVKPCPSPPSGTVYEGARACRLASIVYLGASRSIAPAHVVRGVLP